MFLEFYNLRQQPFGVTPDPAYLYRTRTHCEALSSLLSGIQDGRGFFALIAEPGMGKTTLLYQLLDELHDCARTVFLFQTQCSSREFFQYLLNELGVDTRGMDLVSMHSKLNEILFAEMIAGRRFVLIVDEAQNLEDSVLETVRLLSNFETSYAKMLQIVLAGQPQLSDKLAQPQLPQLRQRLAVLARLEPLSAEETASYIEHRLKIAGHSGEPLFTPPAVALIAERSQGIPRTINHLCYSALCAAHEAGCKAVPVEIVQRVIAKLDGQPFAERESGVVEAEAAPISLEVAEIAAEAAPVTASVDAKTEAPAADAVTPEVSEVPGDPAEESAPVQPVLRLTYEPARSFRLPRWALRASVVTGILFLAGISLTAFMLRLTEPPEAAKPALAPAHVSAPPPPADASFPNVAPSQSTPTATSAVAPADEGAPAETDYTADPQETGATQIITVAAMAGQTIEDISLAYAGRFDAQLLQQIRALNPEMKDPNHLTSGQLIRLPLPRGSFRKGTDLSSEK
jgi:type II secretory pathway predicted ATPase ExeA